jgi:hypothetical protein
MKSNGDSFWNVHIEKVFDQFNIWEALSLLALQLFVLLSIQLYFSVVFYNLQSLQALFYLFFFNKVWFEAGVLDAK